MADDVEVKLGADTGDLTSNTGDAASSVDGSLKKIQASLDSLTSHSKQTSDNVKTHTEGMAAAFAALHENIRVRFGSINNIFEQFNSKLALFGAVFAGGALFKGAVSSLLNLEDSVRGLVITFGMTTEKATQTATALKLAGLSAETYEQMGQRVGRVLRTQSDEFDRLGVVTKDAAGNLLPMDEILQNVYKRMQDFKAGTDQTEFALSTVGRNAKDFARDMQRLGAVQERATQLMHELNIEMGPDRVAQVEAYRINLNAFRIVMETIGENIGEAVLPRLNGLASWFSEYGPTAVVVIVTAIKGLLTVLQLLGTLIGTTVVYAVSRFENLATSATAAWQVVKAAATFNFGAIPGIIAAANAKIEANNRAAADTMVQTWQGAFAKIGALFSGSAPAAGPNTGLPKSGTERFVPKPTGSTDQSAISGLENELKAEQDAYNNRMLQQGSFQTWSIAQTRDYWEEVLSLSTLSTADRQSAENKYYDAERAVQQQAFASYLAGLETQKAALGANIQAKIALQRQEITATAQRYGDESAQAQAEYKKLAELQQQAYKQTEDLAKDHAKFMIEMATQESTAEQDNLQFQIDMRQVAADKKFGLETDLENKLYALKRQEMQNELALVAQDPIAYQKVYEQIELLDQQHQQKLTAIDHAATLDRRKDELQAAQDFQDDFSSALASVVDGTKSVKNAFLDFFKSLDQQLSKIASDQIAKQLFGPGTGGNSFLSGIFGKIFGGGAGAGGASGDAAATASHTTAVAADTAAYTTGTPALSLAFTTLTGAANTAAAALAGVGGGGGLGAIGGSFFGAGDVGVGFGSAIASLDVGTPYVPQDTLAVVHRGEAVIPAAMNRMGGNRSSSVTQHFYISGNPDSRTIDQIHAAAARGANKATRSIM